MGSEAFCKAGASIPMFLADNVCLKDVFKLAVIWEANILKSKMDYIIVGNQEKSITVQ